MTRERQCSRRGSCHGILSLLSALMFLSLLFVFSGAGCTQAPHAVAPSPSAASTGSHQRSPADITRPDVGFVSKERLTAHFEKHGSEFGNITEKEYVQTAQALRDCSAGGDVLEHLRKDGGGTRYDKVSGVFIAYNADGTLRTCFKPHDGEQYFWRQSRRPHSKTHQRERQKDE